MYFIETPTKIDISILETTTVIDSEIINVVDKWSSTFDLRHGSSAIYKTTSELLENFKILKSPLGPALVI